METQTTTKKTTEKAATKKEALPQTRPEHVGAIAAYEQAWGAENVTSEDIIVPKILLMQPMSDFVTEGEAKIGEFRSSLDKTRVLGTDKKPVELIIFGYFKQWLLFAGKPNEKLEYESTVPFSPENATWEYETTLENGLLLRRDLAHNFYCLLAEDVKNGEAFPFVLSCRRTSARAGKKINTFMLMQKKFNKPSASKVIALTASKESNDKGTFFVMDTNIMRDSTQEELKAAFEWYQLIGSGAAQVKVDDSDIKTEAT